MRTVWRVQIERLDGRSVAQIPLTARVWLPGWYADPAQAAADALQAMRGDADVMAFSVLRADHAPEAGRRLLRTITARHAARMEASAP